MRSVIIPRAKPTPTRLVLVNLLAGEFPVKTVIPSGSSDENVVGSSVI